MVKGSPYPTNEKKNEAITLRFKTRPKHTYANIGRLLNIAPTTVWDICKRWKEEGTVQRHPGSGKKPLVDARELRQLVRSVVSTAESRRQTLAQITDSHNRFRYGAAISTGLVRRSLHSAYLFNRTAAQKPFVNARQRIRRLSWAKEYRNKDDRFWANVIWSDESSFELNEQGRVAVWRRVGERYSQSCLVPTFKSGRVNVMIWGCFVDDEKGPLAIFDDAVENQLPTSGSWKQT